VRARDASFVTIEALMADRLRHVLELLPSPRRGAYMCVTSMNDCRQRAKHTDKLIISFIYNKNRLTPSIDPSRKYF
jgi:hypothetical protein